MKELDDLPTHKKLLQYFLTPELMKWSQVNREYSKELRNCKTDIFGEVTLTRDWLSV